ncbi:type II toxin-antitoxin system VapB family antitoxin [Variovorax sp. J22P240]|nr:type II toxin-antitoxin system VapB family antitoxin [Variovorax sp. J22P240]MDL9998327.1 type II toxin-antitoxin system VapB family antitoxin [Variovorax sp. J22P240]
MRITVTIDDELFNKAVKMADPSMGRTELFREVFKSFIQVQAAKRLIALGGSARDTKPVRRRRDEPDR